MDLHKLTTEDLRGFDTGKLRETEHDIRKAMVDIRMDIYTARNQHTAKIRGLRKALARLMTVRGAAAKSAPKAAKVAAPAAPQAPKAPKEPKAAKAAAPKAGKAPKEAKAKAPKEGGDALAKTKSATKKK